MRDGDKDMVKDAAAAGVVACKKRRCRQIIRK